MSRPRLLLMDEPSMGLAPILVERSFEIIQQVHESGVAMLVVEQNANVSLSIADRGYVLSQEDLIPATDRPHAVVGELNVPLPQHGLERFDIVGAKRNVTAIERVGLCSVRNATPRSCGAM